MTEERDRNVDPNRTIPFGEPGQAASPGGEPVAESNEEAGGEAVPPPGTADAGNPEGPPAYHEQPPK